MASPLFLGALALAILVAAKSQTKKLAKKLAPRTKANHLARLVSMLVMTAQISELLRAAEHISLVNVTAALLLFAILLAGRPGTENELH